MGKLAVEDRYYGPDELADLTPADFVALLRGLCALPGRGYLDHPLVRKIEAGTATLPQLRLFVEQFYLHTRNMMPAFGHMSSVCPFEDARNTLIKNLAEEAYGAVSGTKGHPDLLLDFGAAIGVDPVATKQKRQLRPSRKVTDYYEFMSFCRPWYVPVAAIGAVMEASTPDTFGRMADGFRKNYGLKDEQLLFWTMHVEADKEHGDEGVEIVERYVTTPEARAQVLECGVENAENWYGMFDIHRMAA